MITIPILEEELKEAYRDLKYYKNYSERLKKQLQQKENIIKEVREYIEKYELVSGYNKNDNYSNCNVKEYLLKILDKGNNNEEDK